MLKGHGFPPKACGNDVFGQTLLKNVAVNANQISKPRANIDEDFGNDILILTVPQFKPAAESLAVWQKMKGYDVKIESRDSWTIETIKSVSHDFYNNTNPKPGYHIIMGDSEHFPGVSYSSGEVGAHTQGHRTDNPYVCTGGNDDFVPEMSHGRISVDNLEEAMTIVNKIIKYETNPPTMSSFYNNALSCAYFQDHGEDNMTGYADRAFLQVIERINCYLNEDHGITSERIYATRDITNPTNYNNTRYSWGEPIPDFLRKPTFPWINSSLPWDSDNGYVKIMEGFEKGAFLVYHYDHGHYTGWGHPSFHINDVNNLTNGDLLPVVYSIDCQVGNFSNECFAEALMRKKNGGAVATIGASANSWSGHNDAMLQGMIDATWPSDKMILSSPHLENPSVTPHDPIYTLGDICDQGKFRMVETWQDLPQGAQYHYQIYHYFSDPTLEMWTKEPQELTLSGSLDNINPDAKNYSITGLNIQDGFVTLYNMSSGKVIGKKVISGGTANVSIKDDAGNDGDKIAVTVRARNYRPLINTITISDQAAIKHIFISGKVSLNVSNSTIRVNKPESQDGTLALLDIKGRIIQKVKLKKGSSTFNLNFKSKNLARGAYIISAKIGNQNFTHRFNYSK